MHDAVAMRRAETTRQRHAELGGALPRNGLLQSIEAVTTEVLRDEVRPSVGLAVAMHGDHVHVLEARRCTRLDGEALARTLARLGVRDPLHRDETVEQRVLREPDAAHATAPSSRNSRYSSNSLGGTQSSITAARS